jgi:superfamily II RNA helicase
MSGRAGRRGIDKIGYVIITPQLFSEDINGKELENLLFGSSQKIESKFNIDYKWILNLIENNMLDKIPEFTSKSLLNKELSFELELTKRDINSLEDKISKYTITNKEMYEEYYSLINQVSGYNKLSQNQTKKIEQKIKDMKSKLNELDKYNELLKDKNELVKLESYKYKLVNYIETEVTKYVEVLKDEGFISAQNKLTDKGKIASKITELDPITTTNILVSDYLDSLFQNKKIYKILALFTLLCDGKDKDDYEILDDYYDVLKFIRNIGDIKINRELLSPVLDWYDGKYSRDIVDTYDIHEGDLIKSINKIMHLLDEIVQVYMLLNKVEYIELLTELKNKLMGEPGRNIITMESLYLKIV